MSGGGPSAHVVVSAPCYRITEGDTVKMVLVKEPDDVSDTTVLFEVWDVGGAQPPNSHVASVETFWFLAGEGVVVCDGAERQVKAGQFLVLPPGSIHQIRNTGPGKLYAITTMAPDGGFAALVRNGVFDHLDAADRAVARGALAEL